MGRIFVKVFCLLFLLLASAVLRAQAVDDIPIFTEEDAYKPPVVTQYKPTAVQPTPQVIQTPATRKKPINLGNKNPNPNIGRNAQQLNQIGLVPEPLPSLTIPLPQSKEPKKIPFSPKTINNRIQAIDLPPTNSFKNSINPVPSGGSLGISHPTDVRSFELEGFYLGLTPDEIIQIAKDANYKIVSSKNGISKFRAGYYESLCKSRKIYLPADIRACINEMSQKNDTTYLSELKISRPKTRESIDFYFTSPATDNRLWKMVYQNKGDNSLSFTRANTQKKIARKDAFLNAVYNKFGHPDNPEKFIWGSENDAFMQIGIYGSNYDAHITLTDVLLSDEDYFEAEDWLNENKPFERFGFED